jgi:hypothetical protein
MVRRAAASNLGVRIGFLFPLTLKFIAVILLLSR